MFTKGNMLYADAFKYLKHNAKNMVALQLQATPNDFTEVDMTLPLEVSVGDGIIHFGTWFIVRPEALDYGNIKKAVIQLRYSNDDQMALMLNRDDSEDAETLYQKMQDWRNFASEIARKVMEIV